ncbi:MAG: hypothetical protein OCD01_05245 [Fibrobacterales bacterium]
MNNSNLRLTGWIAIVTAFLTIPTFGLALVSGILGGSNPLFSYVNVGVSFLYTACSIVLLFRVKELLNKNFFVKELNTPINILIGCSFISIFMLYIDFLSAELKESLMMYMIIFMMVNGAVICVLGAKVLKIPDALFGLKKSIGVLSIITGITMFTVILLPVSLLTDLATSVLFAILFFKCIDTGAEKVTVEA